MKKLLVLVILLLSTVVRAEGWGMLPVLDSDYKFSPIVSLKLGSLNYSNQVYKGSSSTGVELAMSCPLMKAPGAGIRQHVSYNMTKDGDSTLNTLELNPHYLIMLDNAMSVGFGPGFGMMMLSSPGYSKSLGTLQIGGSFNYDINQIHLGAEFRYQYTEQVGFGTEKGLNNTMLALKAGYVF